TRMKNAAHIAGKNVLIFGICTLVYCLVGFGITLGDGNSIIGTHGFAPSVDAMLAVGKAPYSFFTTIACAAAYLFEVVLAPVSPYPALSRARDRRARAVEHSDASGRGFGASLHRRPAPRTRRSSRAGAISRPSALARPSQPRSRTKR